MDVSVNGGNRPASSNGSHSRASKQKTWKGFKVMSIVLLVSVAVLVLASTALLVFGKDGSRESKYVSEDKLQAVFLNGGQVYFGKVTTLDDDYIRMNNIYYLRVNQQVQPNQQQAEASDQDISLVKLGCELHGPEDQMVINRDQVMFWENLKDDGQVAKAVEQYAEQNPDGQKCETQATPSTNPQGNNNN